MPEASLVTKPWQQMATIQGAGRAGFTLVEVAVAMCLLVLGLTAIYTVQAQSARMMRQTRNFNAASRVLDQREDQFRTSDYNLVSTANGAVSLMTGTAGKMASEAELTSVQDLTETLTISNYARPGVTPAPANQSFTVTRRNGTATASGATSLATLPQVVARLLLTWRDLNGNHRREFCTVISNGGLSLSGLSTKP